MLLKADYIMMYNAPWRVLKGKQCIPLMKEGKILYVNHLMKLSFINSDDSKHIAKIATDIYFYIDKFFSKLFYKYYTLSLHRFVYILINIRRSLYFECILHLAT